MFFKLEEQGGEYLNNFMNIICSLYLYVRRKTHAFLFYKNNSQENMSSEDTPGRLIRKFTHKNQHVAVSHPYNMHFHFFNHPQTKCMHSPREETL